MPGQDRRRRTTKAAPARSPRPALPASRLQTGSQISRASYSLAGNPTAPCIKAGAPAEPRRKKSTGARRIYGLYEALGGKFAEQRDYVAFADVRLDFVFVKQRVADFADGAGLGD